MPRHFNRLVPLIAPLVLFVPSPVLAVDSRAVASLAAHTESVRIAVHGTWLYVADGHGIAVLDAREPRAPRLVGRVASGRDVFGVALDGDALIAVTADQLTTWDLADPAAPAERGSVAPPGATPTAWWALMGTDQRVAWLETIHPDDPRYPNSASRDDFIVAVDTRDALRPTVSFAGEGQSGRTHWNGGVVGDGLMAMNFEVLPIGSWHGYIKLFDTSDMTAPRELGTFDLPRRDSLANLVLDGSRLYFLDWYVSDLYEPQVPDLVTVDVSAPRQPRLVSLVAGMNGFMAVGTMRAWSVATAADDSPAPAAGPGISTIAVADLTDPDHPRPRGRLGLPGPVGGMAAIGPLAYVLDNGAVDRLWVVDGSDMDAPVLVHGVALAPLPSLPYRAFLPSVTGAEWVLP